MNRKYFMDKVLPVIFTINCLYIWIMIILGTIQLFGSGIFAMIISIVPLFLNVYVHIKAYMYIEEENEKKS